MILNALLVVVLASVWTVWESRRHADEPEDPEYEEREVRFGMRLVVGWIAVIAVLVIGLLLQGGGVGAGGWLALAAVAAMLLLFYVVPWLGPRRPKRRRPGDAEDVSP